MAHPGEVKKLSLLEKAVESAPDGIAILDGGGQFIYANQQYRQLFGLDDKRVMGSDWRIAHPQREHEFLRTEVLRDVKIYDEWRGEVIAVDSKGVSRVVELSISDVGEATVWFARLARRDQGRSAGGGHDG